MYTLLSFYEPGSHFPECHYLLNFCIFQNSASCSCDSNYNTTSCGLLPIQFKFQVMNEGRQIFSSSFCPHCLYCNGFRCFFRCPNFFPPPLARVMFVSFVLVWFSLFPDYLCFHCLLVIIVSNLITHHCHLSLSFPLLSHFWSILVNVLFGLYLSCVFLWSLKIVEEEPTL